MSDFSKVGLYDHNQESYKKIKEAFDKGEKVVGIVHATGTGKTYNALQLALDNKNKKITYIVPSNGIIEHIKRIIEENPNLDLEKDFPNLEFRTYQSLVNLFEEELVELDMDMMILDEFHHIGAPVWGARINQIIESHPDLQIFGMTAYTVRDRGTVYERDMANPDGDELFSNKIASRYDLCDAMIDGVLPKPIYKSAHIHLLETEQELEKRVSKLDENSKDYQELMKILKDVRRRIAEAPGIKEVVKKNVKPDGKYIYFCPPMAEDGTNDIEAIKKQALEWFKEYIPEEDIIFYTTTSKMGEEGSDNREAFYNDKTLDGKNADGKLRVMFAINQYNEGIHAPNIDGVIMGRGTQSDIVYFEQLGRALAVRGSTKEKYEEYEKLSKEELIKICSERDILLEDNMSKEEIIEMLLSPVVIDLANNYDYIKELENNLQDRIKEIQESSGKTKRKIKLRNAKFAIEIENQNLYEMLKYVFDRLVRTWEDNYELAKSYYEYHGNLEVPYEFKTINGYEYDENAIKLGVWILTQRQFFKSGKLLSERKVLLDKINMVWSLNDKKWLTVYSIAQKYYEKYGNLDVPSQTRVLVENNQLIKIKSNDKRYKDAVKLGAWIHRQRASKVKITPERQVMLEKIGMKWKIKEKSNDELWLENYELAKKYYEKYGNLDVPYQIRVLVENNQLIKIKSNDKRYKDAVNLGAWIHRQRFSFSGKSRIKLTPERQELLEKIGIRWKIKKKTNDELWLENYELAKKYYEKYGNLDVSVQTRVLIENDILIVVNVGDERYDTAIRLGNWLSSQKAAKNGTGKAKVTQERQSMLEKIGIKWRTKEKSNDELWLENYELAKKYYKQYGNLEVPVQVRVLIENDKLTIVNENEERYDIAVQLGSWIKDQRHLYNSGKLSSERQNLLELIGMSWNIHNEKWHYMYDIAKKYYEQYGNIDIKKEIRVLIENDKLIIVNETDERYKDSIKLGQWIDYQRYAYNRISNQKLMSERNILLEKIGVKCNQRDIKWHYMYDIAKKYYEQYGNLVVKQQIRVLMENDKIIEIYPEDSRYEEAITLGKWINNQRSIFKGQKTGSMTLERKELLESIGMIWDFKTNKKKSTTIQDLCEENNIDVELNKEVIDHISYEEFSAKLNYLSQNSISLTNEDGILHDIFSMCSANMEVKYGISLEDLIKEYYVSEERKPGV